MMFHIEDELSPKEMEQLIAKLIETKTGRLVDLPGGGQLCVVHGEDGHQLEWTRLGDGAHTAYVVRDSDKRVLAESEDGSKWILAGGKGTCVLGDGAIKPQAQFDEHDHIPYHGGAKSFIE